MKTEWDEMCLNVVVGIANYFISHKKFFKRFFTHPLSDHQGLRF